MKKKTEKTAAKVEMSTVQYDIIRSKAYFIWKKGKKEIEQQLKSDKDERERE